jgi:hypothetical protein
MSHIAAVLQEPFGFLVGSPTYGARESLLLGLHDFILQEI